MIEYELIEKGSKPNLKDTNEFGWNVYVSISNGIGGKIYLTVDYRMEDKVDKAYYNYLVSTMDKFWVINGYNFVKNKMLKYIIFLIENDLLDNHNYTQMFYEYGSYLEEW